MRRVTNAYTRVILDLLLHICHMFLFFCTEPFMFRLLTLYSEYSAYVRHSYTLFVFVSQQYFCYRRKRIVKCSAIYTKRSAERTHTFECQQWRIITPLTPFVFQICFASVGRYLTLSPSRRSPTSRSLRKAATPSILVQALHLFKLSPRRQIC